MNPLRLALVVQGRLYMFDFARELVRQGHYVTLFTNYPKRICERFGIPRECVVNCVAHGLGSRALRKVLAKRTSLVERWSNKGFGCWAARMVPSGGPWHAIACMSGIAEDLFRVVGTGETLRVLMRGSVHICEQKRILAEEQRLGGGAVEQPSEWIVAREEREYELADAIQVLSPFAHESFVRAGVPPAKLDMCCLGVDVSAFRAPPEVIEARLQRMASGQPLRLLCTGTFCRRKGARYWREVIEAAGSIADFRFVGTIARDAVEIARAIGKRAEFRAKVRQAALPAEYAWADIFVLPTLEDGFAVVVAQALAAGLPVVTTTSCGASALIEDGSTGWVVQPGNTGELGDCLRRLNADRAMLGAAVHRLRHCEFSRDWSAVACEFAQSLYDRRKANAIQRTGMKALVC